jgi:hypothetical protein
MNNEKPWADEPTPLCDEKRRTEIDRCGEEFDVVDTAFARDLERRLRHANALIGKLRADTDCGDFDKDDLEQRLANIEETLTP